MSKHLICYGHITDHKYPLIEVSHWEYAKLRVQFWKWYKHRTMGRPVLKLWKNYQGVFNWKEYDA